MRGPSDKIWWTKRIKKERDDTADSISKSVAKLFIHSFEDTDRIAAALGDASSEVLNEVKRIGGPRSHDLDSQRLGRGRRRAARYTS